MAVLQRNLGISRPMKIQRFSYSSMEFGSQQIHCKPSPEHLQFMMMPEPIYKRESFQGSAELLRPGGLSIYPPSGQRKGNTPSPLGCSTL